MKVRKRKHNVKRICGFFISYLLTITDLFSYNPFILSKLGLYSFDHHIIHANHASHF